MGGWVGEGGAIVFDSFPAKLPTVSVVSTPGTHWLCGLKMHRRCGRESQKVSLLLERNPRCFRGCSTVGSKLSGRVGSGHLTPPDLTRPDPTRECLETP